MNVIIVIAQYYLDDLQLARYCNVMFTTFAAAGHQVTELRVDMREANGTNNVTSFPFLDISAYCINLQDLPDCDVLLMLNDTFFIKHPWQILLRRMVSTLPLLASLPVPGASGSVHPTTDILMFDPSNPTRRHMSTFFFAANRLGIKVLQALAASLPGQEDWLGEAWLTQQFDRDPALRLLMHVHLREASSPWAWAGLKNMPTAMLVQRKAVSVAFEYLCTQRILEMDGCVLPINMGVGYKLASHLKKWKYVFGSRFRSYVQYLVGRKLW